MRPTAADVTRVCGLGTRVSCAKTAEPIEMPFAGLTRVGPRNHVSDRDPDPPRGRNNFRRCPPHSKALADFDAVNAKTAEPIEIPFWGEDSYRSKE